MFLLKQTLDALFHESNNTQTIDLSINEIRRYANLTPLFLVEGERWSGRISLRLVNERRGGEVELEGDVQ